MWNSLEGPHKEKEENLDLKFRRFYWTMWRKSHLAVQNKVVVYVKPVLKPSWRKACSSRNVLPIPTLAKFNLEQSTEMHSWCSVVWSNKEIYTAIWHSFSEKWGQEGSQETRRYIGNPYKHRQKHSHTMCQDEETFRVSAEGVKGRAYCS